MKIGVISDTHDHLDPRIAGFFHGVDHILHAGDIGLPWIILQLEEIAPVTAVLGNNDVGLNFRETEVVQLDGCKFMVHHIVDVRAPAAPLRIRTYVIPIAATLFARFARDHDRLTRLTPQKTF